MKFSALLTLFPLMAIAQDGDDDKSLGDKIGDKLDEFYSEVGDGFGDAFSDIIDKASTAVNGLGPEVSNFIDSITSEAGAIRSSISEELRSASGSRVSELSEQLASLSANVEGAIKTANDALESAADDNDDDDEDAGAMPTAAVAMGALVGGAAILANL